MEYSREAVENDPMLSRDFDHYDMDHAFQKGQQAVYAEIRATFENTNEPPWFPTDFDGSWRCSWCDAVAEPEDDDDHPPHPDNGCLWAKAQASPNAPQEIP